MLIMSYTVKPDWMERVSREAITLICLTKFSVFSIDRGEYDDFPFQKCIIVIIAA